MAATLDKWITPYLSNGLTISTKFGTVTQFDPLEPSEGYHHNRFTALFPGLPGWASARRERLDFMVQGKINRGRQTDHPAGRHSIPTNQCPPPSSTTFFI